MLRIIHSLCIAPGKKSYSTLPDDHYRQSLFYHPKNVMIIVPGVESLQSLQRFKKNIITVIVNVIV